MKSWISHPCRAWVTDIQRAGSLGGIGKSRAFWPHRGPGHGHFYALLRRKGEPPDDLPRSGPKRAFQGGCCGSMKPCWGKLTRRAAPGRVLLAKKRSQLRHALGPRALGAGSVLRPGWWVATLRHDKIFPDHALAMALNPQDVKAHVRLAPDDERLDIFLTGGAWPDNGPAGYVLVTVDGYPLDGGNAERASCAVGTRCTGAGRGRASAPTVRRRRESLGDSCQRRPVLPPVPSSPSAPSNGPRADS